MEQLSSIDASFIQAEAPHLPMHVTSVAIYDPSTAPQGVVRFKDILAAYENAIYDVGPFRKRLVEVPGKLDFPYWIEDPDFDIEFHVRHLALPQPGDWRQFYIQLGRLHSRGLDMSRPLWEVYVLEGLNNLDGIPKGSFAVVQKLHHAAVDGDSMQRLFLAMHTFEADAPLPERKNKRPLIREEKPGAWPLLLKSYQRSLERPGKLSKAVMKTIQGFRKVSEARERGDIGEAEEAPLTRFNGDISPYRVVTSASFDFAEFKHLRHAVPGSTVNDLAISIIGGALRRYLTEKGEPTDQALIVQIPVNIRADEQRNEEGNKITTINASTRSDIEDPLERLQAVFNSTESGKKRLEVMGSDMLEDLADALGRQVTGAIFSVMANTARIQAVTNLMPGGPNLAFSNMPGPPVPVYFCGAQNQWGIGLGPIMPNMGLFITANSSRGRFIYGVTADREMMPDPQYFEQCLYAVYEETKAALQPLADKNVPPAKAKSKVKKKAKAKSQAKTKTKAKPKTKAKAKAKSKTKAKVKTKIKAKAKAKAPKKKAKAKKT